MNRGNTYLFQVFPEVWVTLPGYSLCTELASSIEKRVLTSTKEARLFKAS